MILRDNGEVVSESESDYEDMPESEEVSDGNQVEYVVGELLVTRQALNTQIKADDLEQQRKNIFHTWCHINNKVCSLIIKGRSCTNVASTNLVEKLGLTMLKHPNPYKLQWLNECEEVKVSCRVLINFSMVGNHELQSLSLTLNDDMFKMM